MAAKKRKSASRATARSKVAAKTSPRKAKSVSAKSARTARGASAAKAAHAKKGRKPTARKAAAPITKVSPPKSPKRPPKRQGTPISHPIRRAKPAGDGVSAAPGPTTHTPPGLGPHDQGTPIGPIARGNPDGSGTVETAGGTPSPTPGGDPTAGIAPSGGGDHSPNDIGTAPHESVPPKSKGSTHRRMR